jgi:hypothetical protein
MGIIIFLVGVLLEHLVSAPYGALRELPSVLSGFGAGITGVGVFNIFRKRMIDKDPQKAKQYEIYEKDERNIRIREKAGLTAWYSSLFMLAAVTLTFVVLNYKTAGFISLGALLFHIISLFIYIRVYNKKM